MLLRFLLIARKLFFIIAVAVTARKACAVRFSEASLAGLIAQRTGCVELIANCFHEVIIHHTGKLSDIQCD